MDNTGREDQKKPRVIFCFVRVVASGDDDDDDDDDSVCCGEK
jgi:hypothetical protein